MFLTAPWGRGAIRGRHISSFAILPLPWSKRGLICLLFLPFPSPPPPAPYYLFLPFFFFPSSFFSSLLLLAPLGHPGGGTCPQAPPSLRYAHVILARFLNMNMHRNNIRVMFCILGIHKKSGGVICYLFFIAQT